MKWIEDEIRRDQFSALHERQRELFAHRSDMCLLKIRSVKSTDNAEREVRRNAKHELASDLASFPQLNQHQHWWHEDRRCLREHRCSEKYN